MTRHILVPVSGSDSVEELIAHLDEVAQPDVKVVFFVRYPATGFVEWFSDHWITVNSARHAMLAGIQLQTKYSWPAQTRLAEAKLSLALQRLKEIGINSAVEIYSGDLREAVEGYIHRAGAVLLPLPVSANSGNHVKRALSRMARSLGICVSP